MDNLSIFDCNKTPLKIDKPIRLIELFAGVGSQAKSLKRLGANFEHYRISEWEVNAAASYKAIHKENDNTDYSAKFTKEELTEIMEEGKGFPVECQFCDEKYIFTPEDIALLLKRL